MHCITQFANKIFACDEDDCDKYGYEWLPQWASRKFYDKRNMASTNNKILFSGQAGKPEYKIRNTLLNEFLTDDFFKNNIVISNIERNLKWDDYIDNMLKYKIILNPFGVLKALNTRAYEVLYSGRLLLQHEIGNYGRHRTLLNQCENIIFFKNLEDLKNKLKNINFDIIDSENIFNNNNLNARLSYISNVQKRYV